MRVRLAVGALVKSVFIKCASTYGSRGPPNVHTHTFLPITNYRQFILNQYQEVGQKPAHSATGTKTHSQRICVYISFWVLHTSEVKCRTRDLGSYSPTILKTILCLFLQDCKFECNTSSDWLNRTV